MRLATLALDSDRVLPGAANATTLVRLTHCATELCETALPLPMPPAEAHPAALFTATLTANARCRRHHRPGVEGALK